MPRLFPSQPTGPASSVALDLYTADEAYISTYGTLDASAAALTDPEVARARTIQNAAIRRLFVASRRVLRDVLARHTGLAPREARIHRTPLGRPFLDPGQNDAAVRFSLSHTTGLVACAVSQACDVGVDAEHMDHVALTDDVADQFMNASDEWRGAADPARHRLDLWVIKEAYSKAVGLGLQLDFRRITVSEEGRWPARAVEDGEPALVACPFAIWSPTAVHRLAVTGLGAAGGMALRAVEVRSPTTLVAVSPGPDLRRGWVGSRERIGAEPGAGGA